MSGPPTSLYAFGPFLLDTRERRLLRDGAAVPLTLKAFDLLQLLVENQGHLVEKEELLRRVWPDAVVEENNLTVTISALRKALGEDPADRQYIETVPRRGYRFVADVRPAADAEASPAATPAARPFPLKPALAVVALLAAALTWLWTRAPAPAAPVRSIAVLPFRSLGNDIEYLGLGMADALITRLAGTRLLVVRSTGTVRRYSAPDLDPVAAGRELGVESVLEGSMQAAGGHLRTTVRLLRVSDGSALWAGTFDEPLTDIFTVQDSISERVVTALALELTAAQRSLLTRRYTSDTEAYQLYLKGRFFWNKRTREGFERGIASFQQAIEKDPSYALAWSGLADSNLGLAFYHHAAPHDALPRAREAALKALQIDGALAEAHASLAHVKTNYEWDWGGAEREWQATLALKPEYATAHQWYAIHYLAPMGLLDKAVAEARRARDLEPLSAVFNAFLGAALLFARQEDAAIEECRKAIDLFPEFGVAHWYLGRAYLRKGQFDRALPALREAVTLSGGSPLMKGTLGAGQAAAGDRAAARATLAELERLRKDGYASALDLATVHAALGEPDRAFEWLDRAATERAFHLISLKVWPEFEPLRADPRFEALVRRVGLAP